MKPGQRRLIWIREQGNEIYSQMIFYREMAAKYGIELFMSECDFVPVEDIYEDEFQVAVKNCVAEGVVTKKI